MNSIPIFLSSDDKYAKYLATVIASVNANTSVPQSFFILDGGISHENKEKLENFVATLNQCSIEFIRVNLAELFDDIPENNGLSLAAYSRFLIPKLKKDLNKAVYLDVDVVVNGDIADLYNQDLEGYVIGAVQDFFDTVPDKGKINCIKKGCGVSLDACYFNSGVLLIDCEKWREKVKIEDLLEIERKYRNTRILNDQDILNKYFENNYKILPEKFNYCGQDFGDGKRDYVVRHFIGHTKPWHVQPLPGKIMPKNIGDFWHYTEQTPFYEQILSECKVTGDDSKRLLQINSLMSKIKGEHKINHLIQDKLYQGQGLSKKQGVV